MSEWENSISGKPLCPPYSIKPGEKPTIHQLLRHPKNVISATCKNRKLFFTVQTDEGTVTLIYENKMKEAAKMLRKGIFFRYHRSYVFNKHYVAGFKCNDEEGYDVQMHYGPDVKVSKANRNAFKNLTGKNPDRTRQGEG